MIEKFYPQLLLTMVYYDGESKSYFTKRFLPEITTSRTLIISEAEGSRVELVTTQTNPLIEIKFNKDKDKQPAPETIKLVDFTPPLGMKAKGKKLTSYKVKEINLVEPQEVTDAKAFLTDDDETGLSPMELHRRAMEKISRDEAQDFMQGGQTEIKFD